MGIPVVIKTAGGMPVTVATSGYGVPMTVATNGFGIAVTQAANGLPVSGITFGPTLQLTGNSVLENSAVNTVVGTVSVTAGTTGTPTYTLTDNAGGKFKLVGNSLQVATATIDYETATFHGITVSVSGLTPTVSPAIFTVYVIDVDDTAPLITSSNTVTNAENSVLAHTLTANETVTWAIVAGGADNARFEISGSTLRWLSNGTKDFEAPNDADTDNAYIVTVRATDTASNVSATQTITVTVTDVTGAAVTAPTLLLTSGTTDNTPDFTLTGDLQLADTVRFQYSTSSGFVGASEITNTIDSTEDAANVLNFSTGALANNTWYFRARIERPGTPEPGISAWSNTETITISVASFSTWNPADKYDVPAQTELQLSAGNLVITGCNFGVFTRCSVRSTTAKSAGKLYFEVTFNVYGNQPRLGLASISHPMVNDSFPGSSNAYGAFITGMYATDIVIVSNAGTVYNDPSWVPSPPVANGDVWGVAVDFATTTMWLRKNGTWLSGNPVTPTGGFNWVTPTTGLFIWAGINPATNPDNVLTLNTGGSAFATAIPSGFTAWG